MKGVTFGDVHTSQFGIYLSSVTIGEAAVREYKIEIPGASGMLDLTDYFGVVPYENRLISFDFTFPQRNGKLLTAYSDLQNAVHGKKLDITLDDNPNYHYVGRVKVGELKKGPVSVVTVECDCEPYKFSNVRILFLGHDAATSGIRVIQFHKLVLVGIPDDYLFAEAA